MPLSQILYQIGLNIVVYALSNVIIYQNLLTAQSKGSALRINIEISEKRAQDSLSVSYNLDFKVRNTLGDLDNIKTNSFESIWARVWQVTCWLSIEFS